MCNSKFLLIIKIIFIFTSGNTSSSVVSPPVEASCDVRARDSSRPVEDVPVRTGISKRKVASAPAAPAYKGDHLF